MRISEKQPMLSFDQACETVLNAAGRLGTERVNILHQAVLNRVLAQDVVSDIDMPPFDKSAMDGFACRRADLDKELTVIETIPAGSQPRNKIGPGQCARIMTGAVVPEGADCVVMVEHTENTAAERIRFTGTETEDNICLKGEDVSKGEVVLSAGQLIKAQHIAVLASVGCFEPLVSVRPRVGIIATGDELVAPDLKPGRGQIRNSNGYQLAAQAAGAGATPTNYGIAEDKKDRINAALKRALAENDVVLVSGGVSVGDYDFVRDVLRQNRVELLFEKVAVKPGRPAVFGITKQPRRTYCFGLPGNPVSTFIMFELLIKPFLLKLMGHDFKPPVIYARLEKGITRKKADRTAWIPVVLTGDGKARRVEYHGSAHITALCAAEALLCFPAGVAELKKGQIVALRRI